MKSSTRISAPILMKMILSGAAAVRLTQRQRAYPFWLDTGVYELTGPAGLASEGWQSLPPMDPGGMEKLGLLKQSRQ
ncbi:hypothetical protein ACVXG7_17210 [Enterobacter hormaechei]